MSSIASRTRTSRRWGVILVLAAALCRAQEPGKPAEAAILAHFAPGEKLRYEFEGIVHVTTGHAQDVTLNVPEDCSYHLRAVLTLDFEAASADGALSGRVHFQGVRYDGSACAVPPQAGTRKALEHLEARGVTFRILPAGDVRLSESPANATCEGVSVVLKSVWDVLQVRVTDQPMTPGPATIPSRRFLYWPDTFVEGMEVAATSMQYRRDATVEDRLYAWLEYKQVFSPADLPAYVETRSRARDFSGTTFVTGKGSVSLLFDRGARRIVFLRRERTIDNRLMLQYEPEETSRPIATYSIEEESTVRWLPPKNREAWLAALHAFESQPPGEVRQAAPEASGLSLADQAARATTKRTEAEHMELSYSLDRAPRGFERWRKNYCSGVYCFELSLAVPEGTKVVDRTDSTVLLLSGTENRTVTMAVGPVLDEQYRRLNEDELLERETTRFIANYLWFAGRSGKKLNFESSHLEDRPAGFSDFTATARDLTPIRGRLVMVIAPYDRLVPIACSFTAAQQESLETVCQTITASVVIR